MINEHYYIESTTPDLFIDMLHTWPADLQPVRAGITLIPTAIIPIEQESFLKKESLYMEAGIIPGFRGSLAYNEKHKMFLPGELLRFGPGDEERFVRDEKLDMNMPYAKKNYRRMLRAGWERLDVEVSGDDFNRFREALDDFLEEDYVPGNSDFEFAMAPKLTFQRTKPGVCSVNWRPDGASSDATKAIDNLLSGLRENGFVREYVHEYHEKREV
jgi:hypothetical protein